ncbi:MAG: hypothetical protein PF495_02760 [Spirochaetales bacterium]|jgi:hypothetical protein|nr:hypothetical protein [Spirochaetales bacterium]
MKKYALLVVAVLFVFTGCAGSHFYKVKEDVVHIYLKNPDAKVVYFASSLDGYKPVRAKKINDKIWEVIVPAYVEFKYFYIVDGNVYLPSCRLKENDDFGSHNCIYVPGM